MTLVCHHRPRSELALKWLCIVHRTGKVARTATGGMPHDLEIRETRGHRNRSLSPRCHRTELPKIVGAPL